MDFDLGQMAEANKMQMQNACAKVNQMHGRTEYGGFKTVVTQSKNQQEKRYNQYEAPLNDLTSNNQNTRKSSLPVSNPVSHSFQPAQQTQFKTGLLK